MVNCCDNNSSPQILQTLAYKGAQIHAENWCLSFFLSLWETQIIEWEFLPCIKYTWVCVLAGGRGNVGLGKGRLYKSRAKAIIPLNHISCFLPLFSLILHSPNTRHLWFINAVYRYWVLIHLGNIDDWTPRFSSFSQWVHLNEFKTFQQPATFKMIPTSSDEVPKWLW